MVEDNLKDFTINWVILSLLLFCLMTFATSFMFNNNPSGLSDFQDVYDSTTQNVGLKITSVTNETNPLLNISAQTNPEQSFLGSRDSVATSYGLTGSSRGFFEEIKIFFGFIITGTAGQILTSVFGGLFGATAIYFITKWTGSL